MCITIGPVLASLYLSFTDYNLLQPPEFSGFENYTRMFDDPQFWASLKVTLIYVVYSVPLQLALALGLALLLDRGLRGLAFYRSVLYLPSLLGGSVAIAILWRRVFGLEGLVNALLGNFGVTGAGVDRRPLDGTEQHRGAARLDLRVTHGDLPGRAAADPADVPRGSGG
ncbi:sugar ABC transporter permease [Streptomyces sp. B6B3]|uniref:carbohydrate ABC transporter permease n=1 Tax=Streptomyces sp. B6B3 TaxID=3153570 RepID=UPI00325E7F79